jgi:hypothetical protein
MGFVVFEIAISTTIGNAVEPAVEVRSSSRTT